MSDTALNEPDDEDDSSGGGGGETASQIDYMIRAEIDMSLNRMNENGDPISPTLVPTEEQERIGASIAHPWWCDRRRCSAWRDGVHHSEPVVVPPDGSSDVRLQIWLTHVHGSNQITWGHASFHLPWDNPEDKDDRVVLTMPADRLTMFGEAFIRAHQGMAAWTAPQN